MRSSFVVGGLLFVAAFVACGDDASAPSEPGASAGTSAAGSAGTSAGKGGGAAKGGSAGSAAGSGNAGGNAGKAGSGTGGVGGAGKAGASGVAGKAGNGGKAGAGLGGGAAGTAGIAGQGAGGEGTAGAAGEGVAGAAGAGGEGVAGAAGAGGEGVAGAGAGGEGVAGAAGEGGAGGQATGGTGGGGAGGGSAGAGGAAVCTGGCDPGFVCDPIVGACVLEPPAPQLLFPVSGDRVGGRPELRWKLVGATDNARVDVCRDVLCTDVVESFVGAVSAKPSAALPRGAYFVRAVGRRVLPNGAYLEGLTPSATRVFFSSGQAVVSRGTLGLVADIDRDGIVDVGIGTQTSNTSEIAVSLTGAKKTSRVDGPSETPNGFPYGGFGRAMVMASDVDGDGYPEIATIDRFTGQPAPTTVVRLGYDPKTKQLVEKQRLDVTIPAGQRFTSLAPLGDIDGDGFADLAVVRALPTMIAPVGGSGTVLYRTGVEIETLFGGPLGWSRRAVTQIDIPEAQRTFESTPMPVRSVGDVDGDGVPDLAVSIQTANPDSCFPARRGRVEIRRGSAAGTFDQLIATVDDWFDAAPLGDVNGDGLADVGVTREPREVRIPIGGGTSCNGSYTRTGYLPGEARVLFGGAAAPFAQAAFTMPVETVAGCTKGFVGGADFVVNGLLVGGGDMDGDGLDDALLVSPDSHPGGTNGCDSAGPRIRLLPGKQGATLTVAQVLATPEAGFGPFLDRVKIIGDLDATGRSALVVVGTLKAVLYAGAPGSVAAVRQVSVTNFGATPLGGF